MYVNKNVDGDLIEQFKDDFADHPDVDAVFRRSGKKVHLKVHKNDGGVPKPHHEGGEIVDGNVVHDEYVVSRLSGSGHAPGGKYTHVLAVTPKCGRCGTGAAEMDHGDDLLCWGCHKKVDA